MPLMSLYVYSTERTCRTKVFTSSAAYATLCVDNRYFGLLVVVSINVNHQYGT